MYGNDIIEDVKDQRSDCLSSEELAESLFAQGDDFTDECTEKEEDLLDGLGSGVEEFEDEGDFGARKQLNISIRTPYTSLLQQIIMIFFASVQFMDKYYTNIILGKTYNP